MQVQGVLLIQYALLENREIAHMAAVILGAQLIFSYDITSLFPLFRFSDVILRQPKFLYGLVRKSQRRRLFYYPVLFYVALKGRSSIF